jgi:prolyl oligopeptidase
MYLKTTILSIALIPLTTFSQKIEYPKVEQGNVVEDYFGTQVSDPYRWLEDENSEATKNFVEQQREVTNAYLSEIPFREKLKNQLADLWDYETMGAPSKHGNYYVLSRNDGKQNQAITYIKKGKDGKEEVFIDPNTFSSDGTTSISNLSFSKDNKYAAYMLSKSGSDWKEIVVLEVATKKYLTDTIRWSKFSGIAWYNKGFYYSGYAIPEEGKEFSNTNEFHTVFYHELGKPQKDDKIIYKDEKNPLKSHYCGITEDGRFLAISGSKGTSGNNLMVKDLSQKDSDFITLIDGFDNDSYLIDNIEDKLLIFTNYKAPNNRVAVTTLATPLSDNWTDFIPEKEYVLESISIAGDKLFATYLKDVQSKIEIYKMDGSYIKDLALPGIGICYGVSGKK